VWNNRDRGHVYEDHCHTHGSRDGQIISQFSPPILSSHMRNRLQARIIRRLVDLHNPKGHENERMTRLRHPDQMPGLPIGRHRPLTRSRRMTFAIYFASARCFYCRDPQILLRPDMIQEGRPQDRRSICVAPSPAENTLHIQRAFHD